MKSLSYANLLLVAICTCQSPIIESFSSSYLPGAPSHLYGSNTALFSSTLEKENVRVQDWVAYLDSKNEGQVIYFNTKTSDSILWFPPTKGSEKSSNKKAKIMDNINCTLFRDYVEKKDQELMSNHIYFNDTISVNNLDRQDKQDSYETKMKEDNHHDNTKEAKEKKSISNVRWIEFETSTNKKISLFLNMETGEIVRKKKNRKKIISKRMLSPHLTFNRRISTDTHMHTKKKTIIHHNSKIATQKKNAIFTAPEPIEEQTIIKPKKIRYTAKTWLKDTPVRTMQPITKPKKTKYTSMTRLKDTPVKTTQTSTKPKTIRYTAMMRLKDKPVRTMQKPQREIYKKSVEQSYSGTENSKPLSKFVNSNDEKNPSTKTKRTFQSVAGMENEKPLHNIDVEGKKVDTKSPLFFAKESTQDKFVDGNTQEPSVGNTHNSLEHSWNKTKPNELITKDKYQKVFYTLKSDRHCDSIGAKEKSQTHGRQKPGVKRHSFNISDTKVMESKKTYKNSYSSMSTDQKRTRAQPRLNDGIDITLNIFGMVPRKKEAFTNKTNNSYKRKDNNAINTNNQPFSSEKSDEELVPPIEWNKKHHNTPKTTNDELISPYLVEKGKEGNHKTEQSKINTNNQPFSSEKSDEELVPPIEWNKKHHNTPKEINDKLIFPYLVEKGEEGNHKTEQSKQAPDEIIIDVFAETIGISSLNENPKAHGKAAFHKFFVTNSYDDSSSINWGPIHVSSFFDQDVRTTKTNKKSATKSFFNRKGTDHVERFDSTGIYAKSFTDIEQEIMEEIQREEKEKEKEEFEKAQKRIEEEKEEALTSLQEHLQSHHKCKKVLSHYPALFDL